MPDEKIYDIALKDIRISGMNVRQTDRDVDIDDLAASIKQHGLLQPVVLRGSLEDGRPYELIVGQRRYLAHKKLGMPSIRARFAGKISDLDAKVRSLAENIHRAPLNHADAAEAVTGLYGQFKGDEKKVAKCLGLSLSRVRQYIDVKTRATPKMMNLLRRHKVTLVDLKRTLDAAGGDESKADRLVDEIGKLATPAKKRLAEYGSENPKASVDTIVAQAKRPRLELTVIIDLPEKTRKALDDAAKSMAMGAEEVAARAVTEWLRNMGFIH